MANRHTSITLPGSSRAGYAVEGRLSASLVFNNDQIRRLPKWDRLRFVLIIIGAWPFAVLAVLVNAIMEDE